VPVGAYLSAAVLDVLPGRGSGRYADLLVAVGLAGTAPAVATGLADFADLHEQQQRVGLVHAVGNAVASVLYAGSLVARLRGRRRTGVALSFAGLAAAGGAAFLGGHLAYRQAAGANHAEDVPYLVEPGWHRLAAVDELPDGVPVQLLVGTVAVVAVRRGLRVDVLSDRCSHLSGPLHDGEVVLSDDDGACLRCPWHGSEFRLGDGAVVTGPATAPQPSFDVRIDDGDVHVRLPGAV
jgi:nitrite reductase/ring-hydroxylating ferredoxin subunit